MLAEVLEQQERQQQKESDVMMEQWLIEQETSKLKKEIDEKNRLFRYQIKRRDDAATVIQRAMRRHFRKIHQGITTTQILERKQLDMMLSDDDHDSQLLHQSEEEEKQLTQGSGQISWFLDRKNVDERQISQAKEVLGKQLRQGQRHKSVGANRRRHHLFNRMRQLQIETSTQALIETESLPLHEEGKSTTPMDTGSGQLLHSFR